MAVREATPRQEEAQQGVSSFAKSLFLGEIHEELVFPWPATDPAEQDRVRELNTRIREYCAENYDARKAEEERWIPDEVLRDLGEIGALGLYVDERFGGQGLSQTGYARVFETVGQIDATLAIVLGVHQSIGFKGISLFGTDEQKERWLPDLATGRKLAAFALTEPEAGSDAYNVQSAGGAAAGRLLGAERGEALHRQRLAGGRDHHVRARRDRRRGPAHRAHPGEGDEGP
jgi:acyl-CoA dehydrogenase family protein 9